MPSISRQAIRRELLDLLYPLEAVVASTTTTIPGATPTTFTDTLISSTMLPSTQLVGAWIRPNSTGDTNHAGQSRRIISWNPATGAMTFDPAMLGTSIANVGYELHYALHPDRVDEALKRSLEVSTRYAITPWADDTTAIIIPDKDIIKIGALFYLYQGMARRARGAAKTELQDEATRYRDAFYRGAQLLGYKGGPE